MKPRAWSHSALDQFNTCPRQYHEVKVLKNFTDPDTVAKLWGNRVHEAFAAHLQKGTPLEPELVVYQGYLDAIKEMHGDMYVECEYALDTKLNPCEWFGSNVFVRGIADVLHVLGDKAWAMDHKTGKRKQDSKQMKLMALLIFAHFPAVQHVKVGFFWLKEAKKDIEWFSREDIPALWNEFLPDLKQFKEAFQTDTWQPRQSGLCYGWCPVVSCEFWKPKRVKK